MDRNVLGEDLVAAAEAFAADNNRLRDERDQLRDQRDRLLDLTARWGGLICDLADRFDAADEVGAFAMPDELLLAVRAVRDDVWTSAIAEASPEDFARGRL